MNLLICIIVAQVPRLSVFWHLMLVLRMSSLLTLGYDT